MRATGGINTSSSMTVGGDDEGGEYIFMPSLAFLKNL
jgi:hypothetical protein